jgi:hypothetical protein
MDGYIQTGLGIIVSLILFVIGYRQTIGARKERARNANSSVHRAIMRRMVLEDYAPIYSDVSRLIEGKAREFQVSINTLLSEEQILNSLYTEVFDSDLISPSQRVEIEKRLSDSFKKLESEPTEPTFAEFQQLRIERKSMKDNVALMVLTASMLGAMSSVLYKFIETRTLETEWLFSGLAVLIASVAVLTSLSIFRKSKEVELSPSRGSAQIISSEFESDIAKILLKNKFDFTIEQPVGNLRPDFLVRVNGKVIAIEAKAWNKSVPMHFIRRTLDYLNKLVHSEGIDQAILVTNKSANVPFGKFENDNISVVSINDLAATLKNAA